MVIKQIITSSHNEPIYNTQASWLKKRPAFVLKTRCESKHFTEERWV